MKKFSKLALLASVLSVSACTGLDSYKEIETLNAIEPRGSAFTRELANEYRIYANAQQHDNFDFPDALHFARKGLAAASGEAVLPEPTSDWNLNEFDAKTLAAARNRLIVAFDYGARESLPSLSAKAQARFDCWIEVQEEYWTEESPSNCRADFLALMDEIDARLTPPPVEEVENIVVTEPAEVPEVAFGSEVFDVNPDEPMAVANAMYLIFFNWDSATVSSNAKHILDSVVTEVNKIKPEGIKVVGHTDTSGASDYNQRLALKRAKAARDELVNKGVRADTIMIDAKGETDLLVPTPDNVREPANRRVNISFE